MQIQKLILFTSKLSEQRAFYGEVMDLPIFKTSPDSFQVNIGTTEVVFQSTEQRMYYHFAINIPSYQINKAHEWISHRTKILPFHGNEIVNFKSWNAEALYFYDPAGNIVEFIARKNLKIPSSPSFTPKSFQYVSEIGLPVKDVKKTFDQLNRECGLLKFSGDFEKFCAIGSETGLFITIDYNQKDWIPNNDKAHPFPFELYFTYQNAAKTITYAKEKLIFS